MRIYRVMASTMIVVALTVGTALAQGNIYQATLQEPNPATAEVSTDELKLILQTGSAVVFDARPFMEFAVSHIPGAVNVAPKPGLPASQYTSDVAEVGRLLSGNKQQSIVLYCNGPFCGKSKRLATDLLAAGYTNVRRYQLGIPTWRALVGLTEIEPAGAEYVYRLDMTAWWVDARPHDEFANGTLGHSFNIPLNDVLAAKDDGRLPMEDHNTRIVVFGSDGAQARAVAASLAANAFHNVAFFGGTLGNLRELLRERGEHQAVDRRP
jgi:rhodanese-related sulfurtransferase